MEDVDVDGIARSTSSKAGDQSAVSLLIKIGHKDPTRPIVKNHHSVVLRAESAAEKYRWAAHPAWTCLGLVQLLPCLLLHAAVLCCKPVALLSLLHCRFLFMRLCWPSLACLMIHAQVDQFRHAHVQGLQQNRLSTCRGVHAQEPSFHSVMCALHLGLTPHIALPAVAGCRA